MGLMGRRAGEWAMAAEALALLVVFRVGLAVMPVKRIIGWMTRGSGDPGVGVYDAASLEVAGRVRWAVEAVARHSWVEFVCFPQTLAGYCDAAAARGAEHDGVWGDAVGGGRVDGAYVADDGG
jgi:hypothetical protein